MPKQAKDHRKKEEEKWEKERLKKERAVQRQLKAAQKAAQKLNKKSAWKRRCTVVSSSDESSVDEPDEWVSGPSDPKTFSDLEEITHGEEVSNVKSVRNDTVQLGDSVQSGDSVQLGDFVLVLVENEKSSVSYYYIAKVLEIKPGKNGPAYYVHFLKKSSKSWNGFIFQTNDFSWIDQSHIRLNLKTPLPPRSRSKARQRSVLYFSVDFKTLNLDKPLR